VNPAEEPEKKSVEGRRQSLLTIVVQAFRPAPCRADL